MDLGCQWVNRFASEKGVVGGAVVFGKVVGLEDERGLALRDVLDELREEDVFTQSGVCLLYTSPSPRDS